MGVATSMRSQIRNALDTYGSTGTRVPITVSSTGTLEGYDGVTETEGTAESFIAVSDNQSKSFPLFRNFGFVTEGDLTLYVRDDQTLNKTDWVYWSDGTFTVKDVQTYNAQDVDIAKMVSLVRRLKSGGD